MRYLFLLTLASSCGSVKFVGNPKPNLKSVHMATVHWNYTQEEKDAHPDYDCRTYKTQQDYDNRNSRH